MTADLSWRSDCQFLEQFQLLHTTRWQQDLMFPGPFNGNLKKKSAKFELHPKNFEMEDFLTERTIKRRTSTINVHCFSPKVAASSSEKPNNKLQECKTTISTENLICDIDFALEENLLVSPKKPEPPNLKTTKLDATLCRKLQLYCNKTNSFLKEIIQTVQNKSPQPDSDEDLLRRLTRVKEFSVRFSRNYLYPLLTQLDLGDSSHKLACLFQLIFNGTQAFLCHLPQTGTSAKDKFKEFLKATLTVLSLHDKMLGTSDFIESLRSSTELTLDVLNEEVILSPVKSKVSSAPPKKALKKPKSRFSMYQSDPVLRQAIESLALKKYNVPSKYKTAQFKHRPPVQVPTLETLKEPSVPKLLNKKTTKISSRKKVPAIASEDHVQTLIQMQNEQNDEEIQTQDLNDLVSECLKSQKGTKVLETIVQAIQDLPESKKTSRKERSERVSGSRNVQLVCIKDENDGEEDKVVSCQTQTELSRNKSTQKSLKKTKINRVVKTGFRQLTMLATDYAVNIIQYKLDFRRASQESVLYLKTNQFQPCMLMDKLSDQVLDLALLTVTQEVDLSELVQVIYQAELQL